MRIYETIYICPPNLDEDTLEEFADAVRDAIYDTGGRIIKQERWGKRRLAFKVKHHREGIYYYVLYGGIGGTKEELERRLKISEECIRFLTVRLDNELKGRKHKIFTKEELRLALQMEHPVRKKAKPARKTVKVVKEAAAEEQAAELLPEEAAGGGEAVPPETPQEADAQAETKPDRTPEPAEPAEETEGESLNAGSDEQPAEQKEEN